MCPYCPVRDVTFTARDQIVWSLIAGIVLLKSAVAPQWSLFTELQTMWQNQPWASRLQRTAAKLAVRKNSGLELYLQVGLERAFYWKGDRALR